MMNKVDCKEWKEYVLENLFQFVNSKAYHNKDIQKISNEGINYITRSKFNNGLSCKVVIKDNYIINPAGTISFGAENADFFYQDDEYITGNKMYYIDTRHLSKNICLFLKSILQSKFTKNFSFSDGMIPERIKKETILLPSIKNKDGSYAPDWQYMEKYIDNVKQIVEQKFDKIKQIKEDKNVINSQQWAYFHLYDMFDIDMGSKLDKIKMKMDNPHIDFVGRANKEQGVTAKVNIIENIPPYKAGNLTLALGGAYLGSCFIQRNDFYTSQNVIVLKPKTNMSFKVKQFLSTTIFVESQLHYKAFIDELNPHIKTDFEFKLPVDTGGNPDWKYMEDYISIIETKVKRTIKSLYQR